MTRVAIVHAGGGSSIVAGVVGGLVVLLGVVLTDQFTRWRDRQTRLEEAMWQMQTAAATLMTGSIEHLSSLELIARYSEFLQQLGRLRANARWPIRRADEIRSEVDAIVTRFLVAMGKWTSDAAGPPRLGPIIGERLAGLILPDGSKARAAIDAALSAADLPTLDESDPEAAHNAPKQPTAPSPPSPGASG